MRIGLPKGRLYAGVAAALEGIGWTFQYSSDRDYRPRCSQAGVEAKLFKARAIPQLLALGNIQAGFCGLDLVSEADYEGLVELVDLGLNRVELVVAVAEHQADLLENPPKRPLLIATEYEGLADRWALKRGLAHITLMTHGATEAYLPEDADIVFDCRETGATLLANKLVVIDRLFASTTRLFTSQAALDDPDSGPAVQALADRLGKGQT